MDKSFLISVAATVVALGVVFAKFGTVGPGGILRSEARQQAERAGGLVSFVTSSLPDSVVDALLSAEYGALSPTRCIELALEGLPAQTTAQPATTSPASPQPIIPNTVESTEPKVINQNKRVVYPVTAACISTVATAYRVPQVDPWILLELRNGKIGEIYIDNNNRFDIGPFRINSTWLDEFTKLWKLKSKEETVERLRDHGCWNAAAAGAILRQTFDQYRDTNLNTIVRYERQEDAKAGLINTDDATYQRRILDSCRNLFGDSRCDSLVVDSPAAVASTPKIVAADQPPKVSLMSIIGGIGMSLFVIMFIPSIIALIRRKIFLLILTSFLILLSILTFIPLLPVSVIIWVVALLVGALA